MDRKYKATLRGRPPPVSPLPMALHAPPARCGSRRSGPQQGTARLSVAWTRHSGEGRVKSQGFPGAPASGQPVWESWWGAPINTHKPLVRHAMLVLLRM